MNRQRPAGNGIAVIPPDGLAERLAGISLRRLSVLMDEAFNIALMLDESFLD